jgi:predicted HicB family RNase H-like nuclease
MKVRDQYIKLVEWSEEDQCYIGSIPGWIGQCCHGENEEKVYHELCQIVDEWVEIYQKEGLELPKATNKKYSGKFQLRLGSELHKVLSLKAMQSGDSLNNFCVKAIKKSITPHHQQNKG